MCAYVTQGRSEKNGPNHAPRHLRGTWPMALRQVRSWLEPWWRVWRYWRAWTTLPPPAELQHLLTWVGQGQGINLYNSS
jgi:hypothetical protein